MNCSFLWVKGCIDMNGKSGESPKNNIVFKAQVSSMSWESNQNPVFYQAEN